MNIINDERLDKIVNLWNRLDSGELSLTSKSNGGGIQYVLPKELVLNEFERITGRGNLIKSSKSSDNYVITYRFDKILKESCELTKQDYYDLLILRILNTDDRPKCCVCGQSLPFSGKMLQGYHQGAGNPNCEFYTCSASCKSSKITHDSWVNGCFDGSKDLRGFKVAWKNYELMYNSVHSPLKEAEVSKAKFLARSNNRLSYFYIIITAEYIKFGITSHHYQSRVDAVLYYNNIGSIIDLVVFQGTDTEVANIEYLVKLDIINSGIKSEPNRSELFKSNPDILNIIMNRLTQSSLIKL